MDNYTGHKKQYTIYFIFFLFLFYHLSFFAQVEYSKFFEFKEGLYLNFSQFRSNAPIPKSSIVSNSNKNELGFLDEIVSKKEITYVDSLGNQEVIETSKLWGYSKNNAIHIFYEGSFNRLSLIGTFSHFVASITTYVNAPDPFIGLRGYPTFPTTYSRMPVKEIKQFVLDTQTGTISDFNTSTMESLLTRDELLYKDFMALKRKKKRELTFLYLRKYNEKHPLVFPN